MLSLGNLREHKILRFKVNVWVATSKDAHIDERPIQFPYKKDHK